MADPYKKVYIHLIFSVENRDALLGWKEKEQMTNYIKNQENHYKSRTFKDEYLSLFMNFEVEYKDEYIFKFLN